MAHTQLAEALCHLIRHILPFNVLIMEHMADLVVRMFEVLTLTPSFDSQLSVSV